MRQANLNRQISLIYLSASDPAIGSRTWQDVMDEILKLKSGSTRVRWESATKAEALHPLRKLPLLKTRAKHFLKVLEKSGVATNFYLREIHSFALDMNWLPWPVLPKKRWLALELKEKRAIIYSERAAVAVLSLEAWEEQLKKDPQGIQQPRVVAVSSPIRPEMTASERELASL